MRTFTLCLCITAILSAYEAKAQEDDPAKKEPLKVTRISGGITFDGIPDEAVWQSIDALPLTMFFPVPGNKPTEISKIRIAYDAEYFYVSGMLYYKDIKNLRAIGKQRDYDDLSTDWLSLILDTYNDRENAVQFSTNPFGLRAEATIKNDLVDDENDRNRSWNTFWDTRAVISDQGWSAEIRIPFSSLRFQSVEGITRMGFIVMRWSPAKSELVTFPAINPKYNSAYWKPSLSTEIKFEGLKPRKPVYITPYIIGGIGQVNKLNEEGTAYDMHSTFKKDAGLDIKYSLTNNLTADLTINTDFAQVEADDQMINLTRYSLYFPEKRVFFLEKSDVFDFSFLEGNNLFYSRRIGLYAGNAVRIYGGARITGKIRKWDVGFLDMQTANFEDHPGENFGVLRLKRNVFNQNSFIGGMLTSRLGMNGTYNLAYGLDGQFRVKGDDYLMGRMAQTFENDAGNQPADLDPTRLLLQWQRRSTIGLGYDFLYTWSGEKYNPGIGFETKNNYQGPEGSILYGWMTDSSKFWRYHRFTLSGFDYRNTLTGEHETTNAAFNWYWQAKKLFGGNATAYWYLEDLADTLILGNNQALVPSGRYSFAYASLSYSSSPAKDLSYQFSSTAGNFYDGRRFSFYANPKLKIGSDFDVGLTWYMDHVNFSSRDMKFTNHILGLKGVMTLTTLTSLTAFIQYNTAIDKVIANVRFRYNPREGNDLYIVYDEGLNTGNTRQVPNLPFTSNRTILLKYTYTFRL